MGEEILRLMGVFCFPARLCKARLFSDHFLFWTENLKMQAGILGGERAGRRLGGRSRAGRRRDSGPGEVVAAGVVAASACARQGRPAVAWASWALKEFWNGSIRLFSYWAWAGAPLDLGIVDKRTEDCDSKKSELKIVIQFVRFWFLMT